MHRLHKVVDRSLQVFVGLSLAVLVVFTFGQFVGRYVFGQSYPWVEELSILILCWTAWTSACLLLRDNRHLMVSVLVSRLPEKCHRLVRLSMGVVVFVFLVILVYASKGTIEAMAGIRFIALPLPINMKFYSVPVGASLLAYYVMRVLFSEFRGVQRGDH